MFEFLIRNSLLIIMMVLIILFKISVARSGGQIMIRKYSLFQDWRDTILSLIFLVFLAGTVVLKLFLFNKLTLDNSLIILIIPICSFFVYPWNYYLTGQGLVKCQWFSLNSYSLEWIPRSEITRVEIMQDVEKVLLLIHYQSGLSRSEHVVGLKFKPSKLPLLKEWQRQLENPNNNLK